MSEVTTIPVAARSLDALVEAAAHAPTSLLWLLDDAATPAVDALDALLVHGPGPAASLPVDAQDRPVLPLMGRVTEADARGILEAIGDRCLPLRHTPVVSLLVERDLVLEISPPDPGCFGWYAGAEWTARLFARRHGVLVPASRVRVDDPPAGSPRDVLRTARRAGWRRGETLRELHRSVVRSVR
ncbi:MAG: hypothetical protein QOH11_2963 [Solirubrobacteraceae bacterium]|nr:hypothetical protein [Solirubrobacteraceae bacterium]